MIDVLHRMLELVRQGVRALQLLVGVRAPVGVDSRSLSSTPQRWGPFQPGTLLRVTASCDAWVRFAGPGDAPDADGQGVPIAARDRHDFEALPMADAEEVYVWVRADSSAVGAAYGCVYVTGYPTSH